LEKDLLHLQRRAVESARGGEPVDDLRARRRTCSCVLTGFWILYSTQLAVLDTLPRTVTDILWTSNARIRSWCKGDVRKLYYFSLAAFVGWGCIAINLAQPLMLVLIGAFVAGFMMTLYSAYAFYVNRKFLPREVQAPLWRQLLLLVMSAFFGIFTLVVILQRVFGVKVGWL
jgi:hypothetical protein